MASILPDFEYDVFISYRHNDNLDNWVTDFVHNLEKELKGTIKNEISIYFDQNGHDGLLETHNVDKSLEGKLRCLIFIPIISQTYCDSNSFAWKHEFCAFNRMARTDRFGRDVGLLNGNVASRVLPVKIHDLDAEDKEFLGTELGGALRAIEFIYKEQGVNRPLKTSDQKSENQNKTDYWNQINKTALAIKELIVGLKHVENASDQRPDTNANGGKILKEQKASRLWRKLKGRRSLSSLGDVSKGSFDYRATIGVLLIAAIGLFFFFRLYQNPLINLNKVANTATSGEKSIAVLPFENLTDNPEMETFCDGITEEILNHLSKVSSLSVTSRTSVKMYKGTKLPVREIAEKLGVTHLMEGSVRKSGKQVRITAQLIAASTDKHIWSEDYDYRDFEDIFTVQTDVSSKVTAALKIKLTPGEKESFSKRHTDNIQAYKLYRKGRNYWDKRSKVSYDSAESNFKKAIDLDPDYALAYSGLADCYTFNQKGLSQVDAIPIAKSYAEKALSIDSTLCEAWTTIGFIQSHFYYQWEEGKRTLQRALSINPSYDLAHRFLGNILLTTGHFEDGLKETEKALSLDPLSSAANMVYGRNLYLAHKYDLAMAQFQKTITLNPNFESTYVHLGLCLLEQKRYPEGIEAFSKLPKRLFDAGTDGRALISFAFGISGKKEEAVAELDKMSAEERLKAPYFVAYAYVGLGNFDEALRYLERAYETHSLGMLRFGIDPNFEPLHDKPQYKALVKKMNYY